MKKAILVLTLSYLCLAGIAASAHVDGARDVFSSCQVEFSSDVSISSDVITVSTESGDSLRIDSMNALYVNGDNQSLNPEQQAVVDAYADQVRTTIPEIVAIALEGVEIALTAVSEVFYSLLEQSPPPALLDSIDRIEEAVAERMSVNGDTINVKGGEINGLEKTMAELEPQIEQAVKTAVGDIVVSIGESVRDGEAGIMDSLLGFAKKAEQFERDIEEEVTKKAQKLERRAEGLCDEVYALQAVESRMHRDIPATRGFDMVKES
jgi:hypothetical protein